LARAVPVLHGKDCLDMDLGIGIGHRYDGDFFDADFSLGDYRPCTSYAGLGHRLGRTQTQTKTKTKPAAMTIYHDPNDPIKNINMLSTFQN
jgi:hypothetical protein